MKTMTQKMTVGLLSLCAAAILPLAGLGEEGAPKASPEKKRERKGDMPILGGQITKIDAAAIELKTKTGETVTVKLTDTTTYGSHKQPQQLSDFHVGDRAVVGYQKADDGTMTATRVMSPPKEGERPGKVKKGEAAQ